jgi:uroporphyrinogen decarboxylase
VEQKKLLATLAGDPGRRQNERPPFWLMRQAGRYLPEYRALRAKAGSFLDLCLNPDFATEVTLQPIRRYGMDGAILFSDILIVPWALGQELSFQDGEGPRLDPVRSVADLERRLSRGRVLERAAPVFETVRRLSSALPAETTLIGFAGAPWTVASYMVEGQGSKDYLQIKRWAFTDPAGFTRLIDLLVDATVDYLSAQVSAGAEVLKLFDSWAGALAPEDFERWVVDPTRRIVEAVKRLHPGIPIIGFPRGAGHGYVSYAAQTGVDGMALDTSVPLDWATKTLPANLVLQGNLDPIRLVAGGAALRDAARNILEACRNRRHIFNLGHGVVQQTPPEHVGELADLIHAWTPAA